MPTRLQGKDILRADQLTQDKTEAIMITAADLEAVVQSGKHLPKMRLLEKSMPIREQPTFGRRQMALLSGWLCSLSLQVKSR